MSSISGPSRSVTQTGDSRRRWRALDGLRGLAVLAVMCFHAGIPTARRGFIGVDVFFVLSGFLITFLLLDESAAKSRIDIRRFYMRRLLRLYPALMTTVAFCLAVALIARARLDAVAAGAVTSLAYTSNLWIYSGHDTVLLQHTWTLSLEEQFYLVWPPLLAVFLQARRWRPLLGVIVVAASASVFLLSRQAGPPGAVAGSYLRAAGLPLGCMVALLVHNGFKVPRRLDSITAGACWTGAIALGVAAFIGGEVLPASWFTAALSLWALAAVPLVYGLVTAPPRLLALTLGHSPLVWVGERSYGLYLWHFPIFSLVLHHSAPQLPVVLRVALAFAITFSIAELSFRLVERPFLRLKDRFRPRAGVIGNQHSSSRRQAVQPALGFPDRLG